MLIVLEPHSWTWSGLNHHSHKMLREYKMIVKSVSYSNKHFCCKVSALPLMILWFVLFLKIFWLSCRPGHDKLHPALQAVLQLAGKNLWVGDEIGTAASVKTFICSSEAADRRLFWCSQEYPGCSPRQEGYMHYEGNGGKPSWPKGGKTGRVPGESGLSQIETGVVLKHHLLHGSTWVLIWGRPIQVGRCCTFLQNCSLHKCSICEFWSQIVVPPLKIHLGCSRLPLTRRMRLDLTRLQY